MLPSLPETPCETFSFFVFPFFIPPVFPDSCRQNFEMNFQKKSDSYPFFGRSSITSSHSENTDSHRYVNSFCPAAGRSPSGLLCQHEKMYRHFPLCSWILCSFYSYEKECASAHSRAEARLLRQPSAFAPSAHPRGVFCMIGRNFLSYKKSTPSGQCQKMHLYSCCFPPLA